MVNISLQVPESKYSFFIELLNSLDYVQVDEIGEREKKEVRKRVHLSDKTPQRLQKWSDIQSKIDVA